MISNELIEKECEALRRSIKKKQRFVNDAPEGKLKCRKNQNLYYWYIIKPSSNNTSMFNGQKLINQDFAYDNISTEQVQERNDLVKKATRNTSYIKKDHRQLAERMALKGLYEQDLLDEKQELKALETYLKHRSKFERRERFLSRSEGIMELVEPRLKSKWSPEVQAWVDDVIECEDLYPENKTHRCKNGLMVSSKSEQLIANALIDQLVPFKYEAPFMLEGQLRKPDFTILNVRTGEEFLWEHFGMMGNPDYLRDNVYKMGQYIRSGYLPFVNFITTFERGNSGVDSMWVDTIIETYLK